MSKFQSFRQILLSLLLLSRIPYLQFFSRLMLKQRNQQEFIWLDQLNYWDPAKALKPKLFICIQDKIRCSCKFINSFVSYNGLEIVFVQTSNNVQGLLKKPKDLRMFRSSDDWIQFGCIGRVNFDWWLDINNFLTKKNFQLLPTNVKFLSMTNTRLRGMTSTGSKFFHNVLLDCKDFHGIVIRIKALDDSPNTDGIHSEQSTGVIVSNSIIGTSDACISNGQGNSQVKITGIICGPGHCVRYAFGNVYTWINVDGVR